ncbi:unnamed protein product [Linum tenue]|uniref:Uncharacterized protein n=1 Tax=Linum tenue TaxID=586396 RepID=A0AAV0KAA6_9ROSI|nr:unnamed protein product [Linum tenue]
MYENQNFVLNTARQVGKLNYIKKVGDLAIESLGDFWWVLLCLVLSCFLYPQFPTLLLCLFAASFVYKTVLSDANKRFLYDVGAYHSDDDDDEDGMGDFLNEMADMMSQTEPTVETGEESFEQLQDLFNEMFNVDIESSFGASSSLDASSSLSSSSTSSAASYTSYFQRSNSTHGSSSPELKVGNNGMKDSLNQASHFQNFSLGVSYHSCLQCHEFNPAL